jgi:hypothetical protein
MTAEANGELRPIDVVKALRARGIDNPEVALQLCREHHSDERETLEAIRATCEWWDTKRGVTAGLLFAKVREGGIDPQPKKVPGVVQARLHVTFDGYAQRFPVGSVAEPHAQLQERRRHDGEPCPGSLIVLSQDYPLFVLGCDGCSFEACLPVASMASVLPRRLELAA